MHETVETTLIRTLTIDEKEIEKIIRDSLGPEWKNANINLYKNIIPAHSVMGAIDDFDSIECKVVLHSKTTN